MVQSSMPQLIHDVMVNDDDDADGDEGMADGDVDGQKN